jgi:transposase
MKKSKLALLGADLSKQKFDVHLQLAAGQCRQRMFANDEAGFAELWVWLRELGVTRLRVGMEATGPYWQALAEYLYAQGVTVYVFNPAYVKAHGQARGSRTKTDRADARLIADYLAKHATEPWAPRAAELEELRELTRLHADVVALKVAASQRAEGLRTTVARKLQARLTRLLEDLVDQVKEAARQQASSQSTLAGPVRRLQTIPGIGEVTALRLVAELPPHRNARSVACWAGVTPRQHESGTSVKGKPRMCKQGCDQVRTALYWPAITALRWSPQMQAFAIRLKAAGLNKMQIIGAVMHKLLRWAVGVLRSGTDFNPALHSSA